MTFTPTNREEGSFPPFPLQHLLWRVSMLTVLASVRWCHFWFTVLWYLRMLSIFSRAPWPSLCLLWRKVHLNLVPLFDWVVSLILRCLSCLYILERNSSWVSLFAHSFIMGFVFLLCLWLPLLFQPEKAMAPHSSTLAWKIPRTEEPGRLQSIGSLRVGHDWTTSLSLFTFMHWRRKWQPTPVFLPGESQGRGSLVGCRLWGHTRLKWLSSSSRGKLKLSQFFVHW